MKFSEDALKGIDRLAAEGRVTERGQTLGPGLAPPLGPPLDCSEKDFMMDVVYLAKRNGWLVYHTYDSRKSEAGFPDLVLVRERILFVETKSRDGELTAPQMAWRDAILLGGGIWRLWRPSDWNEIVNTLEGKS